VLDGGDGLIDRLHLDAEPGVVGTAGGDQLRRDRPGGVARDREGDAGKCTCISSA
jgi:hypothetical protein